MSKNDKSKPASVPAAPASEPEPAPKSTLILPEEVVKRSAALQVEKANGAETSEHPTTAADFTNVIAAACGNCFFFSAQSKQKAATGDYEVDVGQCRARSPSPLVVGMQQHPITNAVTPVVNGYFPPTNSEIWCGDYKPRKSQFTVN